MTIYLKNPDSGEIVEGENFGTFFDTWTTPTDPEIYDFRLALFKEPYLGSRQEYLLETNDEVLADLENSTPIDPGLESVRTQARTEIIAIAAATTFEEVEAYPLDFP